MTNTETQRLARKWVQKTNPKGDRETLAAIEQILATTDPLTMADVEWNDEKHYLAEAVHPNFGKVIMLFQNADTGNIFVNFYEDGERHLVYATPEYLTPNSKRYELREVGAPEQPAHPETLETLETLEDYENAPEGTIVARGDHAPLLKRGPNAWTTEYSSLAYDEDMAGTERQELRKGWGK